MITRTRQLRVWLAAATIAALAAAPAGAYFTPVLDALNEPDLLGPNVNNGEEGILDYLYGLDNLERIDDAVDQIWSAVDAGVGARAAFVAADNVVYGYGLGFVDGADTYTPLFETAGAGYGASGQGAIETDGPFRLYIEPLPGLRFTSLELDNDGLDRMVTYRITQGALAGRYVLAWEDLDPGDSDFNDLVVELRGVRPVPEPAGAALLGAGLALAAAAAWRRRRKSS